MAQCIDCGLKAGCSCQLIKGRCSACNYTYEQSLIKKVNVNIPTK